MSTAYKLKATISVECDKMFAIDHGICANELYTNTNIHGKWYRTEQNRTEQSTGDENI